MTYKPAGRGLQALRMMREDPDKLWSNAELAYRLETESNNINQTLGACLRNGLIARMGFKRGVRWGLPAAIEAAQRAAEKSESAEDEPMPIAGPRDFVPEVDPLWKPPQMVAPRPGTDRTMRIISMASKVQEGSK